jgi:DNA-binding beta-propeller fold protein YncE
MKRPTLAIACTVLALAASLAAADAPTKPPAFSLLKTIPTGSTGRWDYLFVDPDARRLYIPRSTHVQVLDLDTEKVVGDIPDTNGVHGVAIAPDQQLGFASSGQSNSVNVFDLKTLKHRVTVDTGKRPDAILYDPASRHILVMNHAGGDVTVIDPADLNANSRTQTIEVGGTLEFAVSDGAGHVFVNVEDKNEIVQIDTKTNHVLAHWPLAPGDGPTGLALDAEHHRLYAGCSNEKMIVLDALTGKQLAVAPIGKGVDGVAWDPKSELAFSANGKDGTISVVQETSPGKFETVQTVKTLPGARTITQDPKTGRLLLPCTEPDPKGKAQFVIAVVAPAEAGR